MPVSVSAPEFPHTPIPIIYISFCAYIHFFFFFGLSCGVRVAHCQQVENWWGAEREIHSFIYFSLSFSCTRNPSCSVFLTFRHTHMRQHVQVPVAYVIRTAPWSACAKPTLCELQSLCRRRWTSKLGLNRLYSCTPCRLTCCVFKHMYWQLCPCFVSSLCPLHVHVGIGWHFGF